MTKFPYDQFAKDFLESLLSPLGQVQTSLKIISEVREVDVYFVPDPSLSLTSDLGLLAQFATTATVFEPFRNSVKANQIRACMSKLFDLHGDLIREARREKQPEPTETTLPNLWILTPTLSDIILAGFGARLELETWAEGVYLMHPQLKTGIVVIHQLPKTPATLWFRLLGKDRVQARAIQEVAALPADNPYRVNALDLLGNLKVILEARTNIEPEDRDLIMQLSPLYLEQIQAAELIGEQRGRQEGEQRGEQRGRQEEGQTLIIRLLNRRVGTVSPAVQAQVKALPLARLEELGEALLDFGGMGDFLAWLDMNG